MTTMQHKFVEFIPDHIENGILYISIEYCTAIHKCVCGCGEEVVTPITPTDWQIVFDGETVSLNPSIGNWNFECQSHYWITNNKIRYSRKWTKDEIELGRKKDIEKKKNYKPDEQPQKEKNTGKKKEAKKKKSFAKKWLGFLNFFN